MIPKIIHWCWLSGEELPPFISDCIQTWKRVLPDYELRCWTAKDFDIASVPFVEEAYNKRKWASASDYIRLYALYNFGGIYLDSDVRVLKSFNGLLHEDLFSAVEVHEKYFEKFNLSDYIDKNGALLDESTLNVPGIGIQAAVLGASKGNLAIKEMMKYYESNHFNEDYYNGTLSAPVIVARSLYNFGFRYINQTQRFSNYVIFNKTVFPYPKDVCPETIAVHCGMGSWVFNKSLKHKISYYMKTHKWAYAMYKTIKF